MVLVATQVKRRRGTTAENDAFTGAEGEITVDTEKHELRVHDGETQGGFVISTKEEQENSFVHKTGDETIAGRKTFTGNIEFDSEYTGGRGFIYQQSAGQLALGLRKDDNTEWSQNVIQFTPNAQTRITATRNVQLEGSTPATTNIHPAASSNDNSIATTAWVGTHRIIEFQAPTEANGYTWYRKYADGWVEQGGHLSSITTGSNQSISLLVEMLNANYTANITLIGTGTNDTGFKTVPANTTTTRLGYIVNSGDGNTGINWQVSGMAK